MHSDPFILSPNIFIDDEDILHFLHITTCEIIVRRGSYSIIYIKDTIVCLI